MKTVAIIAFPVELGRDPEMADVTNPYGIRWGFAAHVIVEDAQGNREMHKDGFVTHGEEAAMDMAKPLCARVEAHIEAGGDLRPEHWTYMEPRYGSVAYDQQGCEADQIRRERDE